MKGELSIKKVIALIITVAVFLSGCEIDIENSSEQTDSTSARQKELLPYPVIVNDVEIESQPQTVIALSPMLTEMVFELNEGKKLVGRGSYCNYPQQVTSKPEAGSSANPNIDKIIELKPDVLLISTPIASKDLMTMEYHGIKTLLFSSPKNLEEFKSIYVALGLLFNGTFTGADVGEQQFSIISKVLDNKDVVYIGEFVYITEDLKMAGGDTLEHAIFSCFGNNVAKNHDNYILDGTVFEANEPDVILLNNKYSLDNLLESDIYKELSAVENKRIIYVDNLYFERPTAGIIALIDKFISDYKLL